MFEHFRGIRKERKLKKEFRSSGLESLFEKCNELLEEHDLEENLESFFEELYGMYEESEE